VAHILEKPIVPHAHNMLQYTLHGKHIITLSLRSYAV